MPKRRGKDGFIMKGYGRDYLVVAEAALGRPLPTKAVVHHADGNRDNNEASNLVICEDQAYHMLLERRTRALKAAGNANLVRCTICKAYDEVSNAKRLSPPSGRTFYRHPKCHAEKMRLYKLRRGL